MPTPKGGATVDMANQFILQELNYNREECTAQALHMRGLLTDEQAKVFDRIMCAVNSNTGGFFFVYGYGGTGKTFLWNVLTSTIRGNGDIVLNVASSGIAATLLPSGRTAHSRFAIPIDINEDSTCNIYNNSPLANLLQSTKLIIWDEAPMIQRMCIEAFDRSMRDIMNCDQPFGGKCIVLGGDFRQILPVIPGGDRAAIVNASINSSYLWNHCKVFLLTKNMRLQATGDVDEQQKVAEFSEWLLKVGEGKLGGVHDGIAEIEIPDSVVIKDFNDPLKAIVESTYPMLHHKDLDSKYLTERAILAPTNELVDQINDYILSLIPAETTDYFSSDSISKTDADNGAFEDLYDVEFLNTIKCSGIPHHKLTLKVGVPIMLIRNVDQANGLCNGTRLQTTVLGKHFIKVVALNGTSIGQEVLIHRMDMNPSDSKLPFKMNRRQFPIIISFAMTINKSQGQSMTNVGLYLPNPVFSHGQLYVAMSRVKTIGGLKVLIVGDDKKPTNLTTNVVYIEAFQNVHQTGY